MKSVALFGGSFDPPHIGHIRVVEALQKLPFIDTIIVMPTYLNPFKSSFAAPAELRVKWLKEIFAPYKKVHVSSFEANMQRKVPTIESVRYLAKKYDKIYLVIGADNLHSLTKWTEYEHLKEMVTFIVATRNNIEVDKEYITLKVDENIASSELRKDMQVAKLPQKCADTIQKYYKEHNANKN
jgi:nicotinate-nucleotide adenylyltransferase